MMSANEGALSEGVTETLATQLGAAAGCVLNALSKFGSDRPRGTVFFEWE